MKIERLDELHRDRHLANVMPAALEGADGNGSALDLKG